jgi:hypothetical protein
MASLFHSHHQTNKVRLVAWGSVVALVAALYGGWSIFQTYGMSPADGGALRPFAERLAFGGAVAALGVAFAGGMLLYLTLYVVRLDLNGDQVEVETMRLIGTATRPIPAAAVMGGKYYHGSMRLYRTPSVNAPWATMRVEGRRLPYLLDAQAEHIDKKGLRKLIGTAADRF